jgi:hypothetical protein
MTSTISNYQENQIQFFDKYYSILVEHHLIKGKKEFIGTKSNRKCRFCGKNTNETTFRMVAHALPEFIGNKTLIANDECDICNERFSRTVEDHMAKFLQLYRTIGRIPGKKGVPSFKNKKQNLRIDLKPSGLEIIQDPYNQAIEFNPELQQLTITSTMHPHIPVAVYKCLTKMAVSIMPKEELIDFRETIQWINLEEHGSELFEELNYSLKFCLLVVSPGSMPYRNIHTLLLKRKNETDPVPYMIYVVAFGNLLLQVIIPCPKQDQLLDGKQVGMGYYRVPLDTNHSYNETKLRVIDLSSKQVVSDGIFKTTMAYDSIDFDRAA